MRNFESQVEHYVFYLHESEKKKEVNTRDFARTGCKYTFNIYHTSASGCQKKQSNLKGILESYVLTK